MLPTLDARLSAAAELVRPGEPVADLLMILPLSSCYNKENREEILKVYNWADYIDEDVLANFPAWYKQQTGKNIRIIYQTFDINEVMLTKIERGHEDYDVVCPSEYIIERMLRKDLLLPIDTAFGRMKNGQVSLVAIMLMTMA